MPALLIRSESTGAAWRVWPEPEAAVPGAIHETGSYLFELQDSPDAVAAELLIDDRPLEALRATAGKARWRWSPGFHAGTADAELRLPGSNPRCFEVVTDPDIRKLTRDDFDGMVREILEDTFALFSLSSFRRSIARGSGKKPPAIARLEFLRSRVDELERVVASIVRKPRHMLTAEETALPYHRAARATGPETLKSFRTGIIRSEQRKPSRLPAALKGFLPGQIRVRQRRSSLDLPEHRQIVACLRAWSAWLSAVAETLTQDDTGADVAVQGPPGPDSGRLIILDAKYRIEEGLNNALNSIHTYRDALVHEAGNGTVEGIVNAAYLLTPHMPDLNEKYRQTPMPGRLFHPEYRSSFRFGAVTMRPGMTMTELRAALRTITADAAA
jgi:hypothetical protein